jgi:hypothetical protein
MTTKNGEYRMINSPFKWVGGKSRLRKQIVAMLPAHTCYVELFAGAAWVLFCMGKAPPPIRKDHPLCSGWVGLCGTPCSLERTAKHAKYAKPDMIDWEHFSRISHISRFVQN